MLALLGIVILTAVVSVGLTTVINGQTQTRHDSTFTQALSGAESGLDSMVARIKAAPSATTQAPISGTNSLTGASYQTSASDNNGSWLVDSIGSATTASGTKINREIQETITVRGLYSVPLFGSSVLTMGSGSGVNEYDSGSNGSSLPTFCGVLANTGILGLASTTMCTPAITSTGPAATNGSLTAIGTELGNFSEVDLDNSPPVGYTNADATGTCIGDQTACGSPLVVRSTTALSYPPSTACSNGVGINASAVTGSSYLAAGAVYSVSGNLTLTGAVTANLSNLSSSAITLCFSTDLTIPALGVGGVTVPWNSYVYSALPLKYAARPPSTLSLIDTATSGNSSTITIGSAVASETALSAVIYAPNATCVVNGHLDLYGVMICGSITASNGISVHYDKELSAQTGQQTVSVSNWHEIH